MAVKVGINGFGRIGRVALRAALDDPDIEVVAINDLGKTEACAHLLRRDSVHGKLAHDVAVDGMDLIIDGEKRIKGLSARDPKAIPELPWGELGVDVVLECTGKFRSAPELRKHLECGAKKVVLSAPAKGEIDGTFVVGVNTDAYDPATMHVVSNASCTTNCLAPVAKVLVDAFGIERGFMTTVHSYTTDQRILDNSHKDLRRARGGACSIVPTTPGAAKALGLVIPELKGKLDGTSARVPTPDGSMVDLTVELKRDVTVEEVNAAMKAAAAGALKGILEYSEEPLVSADIIGEKASSIFDAGCTMVLGGTGNLVKVMSWYDNEMGYSCRLLDLAKIVVA
jgi:glyceraldehyde 3-phosphate dehydrogenase